MDRPLCLSRRWDLALLLVSLLLALGLVTFAGLVLLVRGGTTQELDEQILLSLRDPQHPRETLGPAWLRGAAFDITALGSVNVLLLLVAGVTGYLVMCRKFGAALFLVGVAIGGTLLNTLLKQVIDRPRPTVVPRLVPVHSTSFPSGHSMLAAVIYLSLGALLARLVASRVRQVYFLAVALVLTVLVGCSRVYLGVHYPSDVLAGWSAGLAWALLCWLAARYLQHRRAVEPPAD